MHVLVQIYFVCYMCSLFIHTHTNCVIESYNYCLTGASDEEESRMDKLEDEVKKCRKQMKSLTVCFKQLEQQVQASPQQVSWEVIHAGITIEIAQLADNNILFLPLTDGYIFMGVQPTSDEEQSRMDKLEDGVKKCRKQEETITRMDAQMKSLTAHVKQLGHVQASPPQVSWKVMHAGISL